MKETITLIWTYSYDKVAFNFATTILRLPRTIIAQTWYQAKMHDDDDKVNYDNK